MNKISNKKELDLFIKNESNYLIISTEYLDDKNIKNQVVINNSPINISKIIENKK